MPGRIVQGGENIPETRLDRLVGEKIERLLNAMPDASGRRDHGLFLVKSVFRFRGGDEMLDSLGGEEPSLWRGIRESSVNVPWGCTSGTGTARRM